MTFRVDRGTSAPAWWARLAGSGSLFADARWLDAFAAARAEPESWWLGAGQGPDIGLRGLVVDGPDRIGHTPHRLLFERTPYRDAPPLDGSGAPPHHQWLPALVCVLPGLDCLPVGRADDTALLAELLHGLTERARDEGMALAGLLFLDDSQTACANAARIVGYHRYHVGTVCDLRLDGRSAEEIFAGYSANQRSSMRRLRRSLRERGITVTDLARPRASVRKLVDLRCAHLRAHGRQPDVATERAQLERMLSDFADHVTVYGAFGGDGDLRAFSMFVHDRCRWHAFMTGREYGEQDDDIYFELMYYRPIEDAATRGIPEISFGYGTEEAKRRRGCTTRPVYAWLRGFDPDLNRWLETHEESPTPVP